MPKATIKPDSNGASAATAQGEPMPMPARGGSYTRQPDGSLKPSQPQTAAAATAPTQPAAKTTAPE